MKTKNWYNNNPFFTCKDGYDSFVTAMRMFADEGELPKSYDSLAPEAITTDDIKEFAQRFMRDADLSIDFNFAVCPTHGKLNCVMTVDDWR